MRLLLKTMNEKSVIEFGKNKGLKVGEVLKLRKSDIIYIYFHYGNITFTEDIIKQLNLKPNDILVKPSKAPEKFDFYCKRNYNFSIENKLKLSGIKTDNKMLYSKGAMKARNNRN